MNNKILTISVAAYNIENLIKDNLESFIKCKEKESIEVIVVDDGSKDSTAKVVEEYEKKYPSIIKLIKKKNEGAGSTVNYGIKNATGKFFKMIDGDDWVESENLDVLINKLKNLEVDMVITNHKTYDESQKKVVSESKFDIIEEKICEFNDVCKNMSLKMHNVIYKTDILKNNNIVLDNGFYTDMEYLLLPLPYINTVIYYDINIYMYRIARAGQSVSLVSMQKHVDMHNIVLKRLIQYYNENSKLFPENVDEYFINRLADMADTELMVMLTFENNALKKKNILEYFDWLKNSCNKVYNKFIQGKKEKMLLTSNFRLIWLASKIVMRKF